MIKPNFLRDLKMIMSLLLEQTDKFVQQTTTNTRMGQYFRARQQTLERIRVYVNASGPEDSIQELKDSISVIRDESLSQIDGDESIEIVAAYTAASEFLDYLG